MRAPTSTTLFSIHTIVTILAAVAFILLNVLTNRDQFWAIWPIWVLLMALGAHAGLSALPRHRLLGLWLGFGIVLNIGLIGIDLANDGPVWWFWPAGVWVVLTALVIGLSVDLLGQIPTQGSPPGEDDAAAIDQGTAPRA